MSQPIHATCVALGDKAVLITGASGRGKSALGLTLMAFGCTLVADDRVVLEPSDDTLLASAPPAIQGMIEARGIGLLRATNQPRVPVKLIVDLDHTEHDRLPQRREMTLMGCVFPLIYFHEGAHFAPAILQYLKAGWSEA